MDIASKLSKYWKYIGQYLVSPLTKSDIEYVILAGSSLLGVFEGKNVHSGHLAVDLGASKKFEVFKSVPD